MHACVHASRHALRVTSSILVTILSFTSPWYAVQVVRVSRRLLLLRETLRSS